MRASFLSALAFFLFINSLSGQDPVVREQLLRIAVGRALQGYGITHDLKYSQLNDDYSESFYFDLRASKTYIIDGVCDKDCRDLDLCLFDESGNEIGCDAATDDHPVVQVSPRWTGQFRLRAKMYNCQANPCRFGIMVCGKEK